MREGAPRKEPLLNFGRLSAMSGLDGGGRRKQDAHSTEGGVQTTGGAGLRDAGPGAISTLVARAGLADNRDASTGRGGGSEALQGEPGNLVLHAGVICDRRAH